MSRLDRPPTTSIRSACAAEVEANGKATFGRKSRHSDVADFLTAYRTHPEAYRVNSALLAEFIGSMVAVGELTDWTIALIGGGRGHGKQEHALTRL